jgi:hypothetical protein
VSRRARGLVAWAACGAALAAYPGVARAARVATVDTDEVEVYDGPARGRKVIEKLPRGSQVAASNQPLEGFYKVRLKDGAIGFIAADTLVLGAIPTDGEANGPEEESTVPSAPVSPPPSRPAVSGGNSKPAEGPGPPGDAVSSSPSAALIEPAFRQRPSRQYLRFKALGGYDFFKSGDINSLYDADVLKFGYSMGLEMEYLFTPDLAMVVRFERVFKSVLGRDRNTTQKYDLQLGSWPLMTGVELTLTNGISNKTGKGLVTHFAVLGGIALQTQLTAEALSQSEPNITELSSPAFTGIARVDASYSFSRAFSLFAEGGYRYLKTTDLIPALAVNGSAIFQSAAGVFIPVSLDLSGPFVGAGAAMTF